MSELTIETSYCCNAGMRRIGRCSWVCAKCGNQQMFYIVLLSEAMMRGEELNKACDNILKEQ